MALRLRRTWNRIRQWVRYLRRVVSAWAIELLFVAGTGVIAYTTWQLSEIAAGYVAGFTLLIAAAMIGIGRRPRG